MARKKQRSSKKLTLKLTDEQLKALSAAFGPSVVKRLKGIKVEQVAGYVKAEMQAN
jgi:hypothetical protein